LTQRVYQSSQNSRTGKLSRTALGGDRGRAAGLATTNPWHQLYLDVKERCGGKGNPAKAAVAR
jgi:hypothetical protein